jgi:hypothetical protein
MGRSCLGIPSPAEPASGQGEAEAFGLLLGEGVAVADGDGQGVGEALPTAVADGLAAALGDGFGDGVAVAEPEGVGLVAAAQMLGAAPSSVWFAGELVLPLPSSNRAAGTTSRPRMTVITKASAPHSWSQKARDELRIRARRPSRAEACCAY